MSKVEIEKNVPIPESVGVGAGVGRGPKYPWEDMEVGDSFVTTTKNSPGTPKELRDEGRRFKAARIEVDGEDDEKIPGWRVWRTE